MDWKTELAKLLKSLTTLVDKLAEKLEQETQAKKGR